MNKKKLLAKIDASKLEVGEAEGRLTEVLRVTKNLPRAEKTTVTESLREALAKLRAARKELEELREIIGDDT